MEKTLYQIKMDFRQAKAQADRIDALANRMYKISDQEYESTLRTINGSWNGENAEAFVAKGIQLQVKIRQSAADLRKAAQTIRRIAQNTYEAEMRAYNIARQRSYQGGGGFR